MMQQYLKFILATLIINCQLSIVNCQIPLPQHLPQGHPRLLTADADKPELQKQIAEEAWAKEVMTDICARIDPYVDKVEAQPDWLLSRLMMYWTSHATDVYINGGVYVRADGKAPVPTVRFGSTRGINSPVRRPKIEAIIPYMDDTKGVFFENSAKEGHPLEWTEQANVSGGSIEGVNSELLRLARDAAFVYWLTGKEEYARLAFGVFDTYMTGIFYRNAPVDLGHGHAQTLVGMTTFEVIQEHFWVDVAACYDFLFNYISKKQNNKIDIYEAAFKKSIDLTVAHGVPHNNWDLHQANIILNVAMILNDNARYADGKGREYYLNQVLNVSTPRQWAIPQLMAYGYDEQTGIWNECPGYALSVTDAFMRFIVSYDNTFHQNLLPYTPVMYPAVEVIPQYLFPNGLISGFGDTHYSRLNVAPVVAMIRMAQRYGDKENERRYTRLYKWLAPDTDIPADRRRMPPQVASFFTEKPLTLDPKDEAGVTNDFITPTFYAPNVSWFVQRNNYNDSQNALMISEYASLGNHAHSNGIAMELYGKGFILGPESGIGSSYFEKPYLEYYSQFPAHNTVMVDGISKYPEMLSNHAFDLEACYPASGQREGFYPNLTYSDVSFVEPESQSNQRRLMSIVRTGPTTGYYVDIFRSRKQRQSDKFHDYFYHNLGQELSILDGKGQAISLQPSEEMAFAGGHLFALDYMWDKRSARTNDDYRAVWRMAMPDGNHISMNLWMKGAPDREIFSIKAPPCEAFRDVRNMPYDLRNAPLLTIAARQHGEAWNRPFVVIYEPTTEREGRSIASITPFEVKNASPDFVGLEVKSKNGRTDYIFSSTQEETVSYADISARANYAVVSEQGSAYTLFMGKGTNLSAKGITLSAAVAVNAVLEFRDGAYYFSCDGPIVINKNGNIINGNKTSYQKINL